MSSAATAGLRQRMLSAYRKLQRTQKKLFINDKPREVSASAYIRQQFVNNAAITDPARLQKLVDLAEQSNEFIKKNVVQMEIVPPVQPNDAHKLKFRFTEDHLKPGCSSKKK